MEWGVRALCELWLRTTDRVRVATPQMDRRIRRRPCNHPAAAAAAARPFASAAATAVMPPISTISITIRSDEAPFDAYQAGRTTHQGREAQTVRAIVRVGQRAAHARAKLAAREPMTHRSGACKFVDRSSVVCGRSIQKEAVVRREGWAATAGGDRGRFGVAIRFGTRGACAARRRACSELITREGVIIGVAQHLYSAPNCSRRRHSAAFEPRMTYLAYERSDAVHLASAIQRRG
jgi:hypothetical protein